MWFAEPRIGYVLKRYPRYSETFIVNEILAHEAAGLNLTIFALLPPTDAYFQDAIARVRAPVHYLTVESGLRASDFWDGLTAVGSELPQTWATLAAARGEEARAVYQSVLLARAARRFGLTHLHAHFATSATSVARLAARMAGLPYSFTAHAKDIFHANVAPEELRCKLADASAVATVSDFNVAFLRDRYGQAAEHVQRIYNGLELDRFAFQPVARNAPHIVAVGRLVEKKGFADLIDACAVLACRNVDFSCEIVGSGPLQSDLCAQICRLGLEGRVSLTGPRPQQEIIGLVRRGAVFVAPCVEAADGDRDGLPTVLLEAMALGTPCVATAVTGIPEIIRDGVSGLLVPQREPAALARAIERLLSEPATGRRLAGAARQLIETEFDIHRNTAQLRSLFQPLGIRCAIPAEVA
jgi:colanic acid/amylovoran biosynthesis glycosyltransferase